LIVEGRSVESESSETLYIEELKRLCSVEKQLAKALPEMAKQVDSEDLRTALKGN